MIGSTNVGGGGGAYAFINVDAYPGVEVSATNGHRTVRSKNISSYRSLKLPEGGTWVVTAIYGNDVRTESVNISYDGQKENVNFGYVFGIRRSLSTNSTLWERTDNSTWFTATASIGTSAGYSDFNRYMPWSGMERITVTENSHPNIMVKIPAFYYQRYRDNSYEYIRIANLPFPDFVLHPAFQHNGTTQNYICFAAYKSAGGESVQVSYANSTPTGNVTRGGLRNLARGKGTGWSLVDISSLSAVTMLMLVEFANNNVQNSIGYGYLNGNSAYIKTGTCDSVPNLTGVPAGTTGKVGVVYRGIEDLWGNIWEYVDGLNCNGNQYWICNNISQYADDTSTNYTRLSYNSTTSQITNQYITAVGYDSNNPAYMLPTAWSGGSGSTYYADTITTGGSGWHVVSRACDCNKGEYGGIFNIDTNITSSFSSAARGSRLLYIPS